MCKRVTILFMFIAVGWLNAEQAQIIVENHSVSQLNNFQIKIALTPSNFNYNASTNDGRDLRIVDPVTNDTLPLWIESWNPMDTSIIWTKVPQIAPNSSKTLYLIYGDPSLPPVSNGRDVFIFFEDFENGLDSTIWNFEASHDGNASVIYDDERQSHAIRFNIPTDGAWVRLYTDKISILAGESVFVGYKVKWNGGTDGGAAISSTLFSEDGHWEPTGNTVLWGRYGCYGGCDNILLVKKAQTPIWGYHSITIEDWNRFILWKRGHNFGLITSADSLNGEDSTFFEQDTLQYLIIGGKKDTYYCPGYDGEWFFDDIFVGKYVLPDIEVTVQSAPQPQNEMVLRQISGNNNSAEITGILTTSDTVSGIEGNILYDVDFLQVDSIQVEVPGFILSHSSLSADSIRFLIFSTDGSLIPPGVNLIFTVYCTIQNTSIDSSYMDLSNVKIVDPYAQYLPVTYHGTWVKKEYEGGIGDLNMDGTLDIADVIRIINIAIGRPPEPTAYELWAGDINNDGTVDAADAVLLVNQILGNTLFVNSSGSGENIRIWGAGNSVMMSNDVPIQAIQMEIEGDVSALHTTDRSGNLRVFSYKNGNVTRVIMIGLDGSTITPGSGEIFSIESQGNVTVRGVKLVSSDGNKIEVGKELNLSPIEFSISSSVTGDELEVMLTLAHSAEVEISIYDATGRKIQTLIDGRLERGTHSASISAKTLPSSGVYFIRAGIANKEIVRKIVIRK